MSDVICLGILVADVIGRPIDAAPARGALELVPSITLHVGGCAANTGIGLRKMGIDALVVGQVGRDGLGDFVEAQLVQAGVKTRITRDEAVPTSATMVLVSSDAERSFLHCTGANATYTGEDFDLSLLDGAKLLHIAGHGLLPAFDGVPCARLLQAARERGIKTSLDTAGAPDAKWRENLLACLPHLDYFLPSYSEVEGLFPDADTPTELAKKLLELGIGAVVLKMGAQGSQAFTNEEAWVATPVPVAAVDATGAGDAFAAGFLTGILNDFHPGDAAMLGNGAGARCVTAVGATEGLIGAQATMDWMAEQHQKESLSASESAR